MVMNSNQTLYTLTQQAFKLCIPPLIGVVSGLVLTFNESGPWCLQSVTVGPPANTRQVEKGERPTGAVV